MPTRTAGRTISLNAALSLAEELVSAPGNNTTVVWIESGRGGVVLRQQRLSRSAQATGMTPKNSGASQR